MQNDRGVFWTSVNEEIRRELLASKHAKESGDYLQSLVCPVCRKSESWTYKKRPSHLFCGRLNECGTTTPTKAMFPALFSSFRERFPSTKESPNATASAYLESRGLDPTKIKFRQSSFQVAQEEFSTVAFELAPGVLNHRLIDYAGRDKNRNLGSYKGKVCPTYKNIDPKKPLWITEGYIDALSLADAKVGAQAAATLSAAHTPAEFLKELPIGLKAVVLAFDSDHAGAKATQKHQKWLAKHRPDLPVVVCIPPDRLDWNDLLLQEKLNDEEFKTGFWRGRLFDAKTVHEYHETWCEKYGYGHQMLIFKRQTYWCSAAKGKGKDAPEIELKQKRLINAELKLMYDLVDSSLEYQHQTVHRFLLLRGDRDKTTLELTPDDFANAATLRSRLLAYRTVFFGIAADLPHLAEYYFKQKPAPPRIRQLPSVGHDPQSGAIVLPHRAYATDGTLHQIGKQRYFEELRVSPFLEKHSIPKIVETDMLPLLAEIEGAFGINGLLALGYWTAAAFSHKIFEKTGMFPFLSLHGAPRTGKSFLTHLLQKCYGTDWEGLSMSKANTKKGELRILTQFSSLVIPMLEAKAEGYRFDFESILELYNRNSLQIRANTSNDNSTNELALTAALAFVQNAEQFASRAAKERVVSLRFNDEDADDETYAHWEKLNVYSPEELAWLGHKLWQGRRNIESAIVEDVVWFSDYLTNEGVGARRIADNHAIVLAGLVALCNATDFKSADALEPIYDATILIAQNKIETARAETPLADIFMAAIDDVAVSEIVHPDGVAIKRQEKLIIVRMDRALKLIEWRHNPKELFHELKKCDRFVDEKRTREFGTQCRVWVFHAMPQE